MLFQGDLPNMTEQTQLGYSLYRLGQELIGRQQLQQAREAIELSLDLMPAFSRAHFDLGNLLHTEGRNQDAVNSYRRAVDLEPDFPEAWYNLGVVLMIGRKFPESADAYRHAVNLKPDYSEAHNNLGILLQSLDQPEEAIVHYQEAIRLRPDFHEAHYNLALLLQQQGRLDECLSVYQDLLIRKPDHVDARNNRANVLLELGLYDEARTAYRGVIARDKQHPEANWNLGLVELQLGRWREGWERYEWRFKQPSRPVEHRNRPLWDGRPLKGRRILLYSEQGLGDAIQFIRFVPQVVARGGNVWIECHAPLIPLFARMFRLGDPASPCPIEGISAKGEATPDYDYHSPIMSLPRILGVQSPDLVPQDPYLLVDDAQMARYRAQLREFPKPWIGLTWSGNPQLQTNAKRSLAAQQVVSLRREMPGTWFSLQRGVPSIAGSGLVSIEEESSSMDGVAALIANLDLVLTVDTSIAHLAGALGQPVWTLLSYSADWRWMTETNRSVWYPSMSLFRQQQRGNWDAVVRNVRNAIEDRF